MTLEWIFNNSRTVEIGMSFREAFKKKRNKKCGFFPHWGGVECSTVKSDLIDVQIHMLKPPVGNYPNILSKFYPDLP